MKKQNKTKLASIQDFLPIIEALKEQYTKCKWWEIRKKRKIVKLGRMTMEKVANDVLRVRLMKKMEEKKK